MRKRFSSSHSGQVTVEFAFAISIFLLLVLTVIEGGRLMFTWTLLSDASRVGARTAILTTTTDTTTVKNAVVNTAKWVPGLTNTNVAVTKTDIGGTTTTLNGAYTKTRETDTLTVRITYTFNFLSGRILPFTSRAIIVETDMKAEG